MAADAWTIGEAVGAGFVGIIAATTVVLPFVKSYIRKTAAEAQQNIEQTVTNAVQVKRVNGFLEGFLRGCPYPAWVKIAHRDDNGKVTFRMQLINQAYEREFGVPEWKYRDATDFDVWPPDVAQAYYTHDAATLASKGTSRFMEPVRTPKMIDAGEPGTEMEFEKTYVSQHGIEAIVGFMRPPLFNYDQAVREASE